MLKPHAVSGDRKLGDLPGSSDHDKIEVWERTDEEGNPLLEIVDLSWGSGIGWYVQKRVTLEAGQIEGLKALLSEGAPVAPRLKRSLPPVIHQENVIRIVFPE